MLRNVNDLLGFRLAATDGDIGEVDDMLFDDRDWRIRYFVVDTGDLLPGRRVLINSADAGAPDYENHRLPVDLTTERVKEAPSLESHQPVSRQHEQQLISYYGWDAYWMTSAPVPPPPAEHAPPQGDPEEPTLRSVKEIDGYALQAVDKRFGDIQGCIADAADWKLRYVVVDIQRWIPGSKLVLLAVNWLHKVDWTEREVAVDLASDKIKESPEWDGDQPVHRGYEQQLHGYYGRPGYWQTDQEA